MNEVVRFLGALGILGIITWAIAWWRAVKRLNWQNIANRQEFERNEIKKKNLDTSIDDLIKRENERLRREHKTPKK